jgi:hypothetical protein
MKQFDFVSSNNSIRVWSRAEQSKPKQNKYTYKIMNNESTKKRKVPIDVLHAVLQVQTSTPTRNSALTKMKKYP